MSRAVTTLVLISGALSAVLVACGGGQSIGAQCEHLHAGPAYLACMNGEPPPEHHRHDAAQAPSPPAEEVGGPLSYVGTITGSSNGTTISDRYSLGPPIYSKEGTPPAEALSACLVDSPAIIARSVFARGTLTLSYESGTLPLSLGAGVYYVQAEHSLADLTALEIDGQWHCAMEELDNISLELEPGEELTLPFWVVFAGVLSNAQPRVSKTAFQHLYFGFLGEPYGEVTVRGPGNASCPASFSGEEQVLLLYGRSGEC